MIGSHNKIPICISMNTHRKRGRKHWGKNMYNPIVGFLLLCCGIYKADKFSLCCLCDLFLVKDPL